MAAVIGSGFMAQFLTPDKGLQLLINALSTILALGVLIWLFGEISGAHFNPVVSLVAMVRGELSFLIGIFFVASQIIGGFAGTALANGMYKRSLFEASLHHRSGSNLLLGEVVATSGLIIVIFSKTTKNRPMYLLVPAWIGAAYFFTSSTSFANPAITVARAWSNSFAGIAPSSVPAFIAAQILGGILGFGVVIFFQNNNQREFSDK